jgi:hypothetical protein
MAIEGATLKAGDALPADELALILAAGKAAAKARLAKNRTLFRWDKKHGLGRECGQRFGQVDRARRLLLGASEQESAEDDPDSLRHDVPLFQ